MKLIHDKDFDSLTKEIYDKMSDVGFCVTPGSIAKLFVDIISKYISEFYDDLVSIHMLSFLSTSNGKYVDMIGALVNCQRNVDETDDSYKSRITSQVEYLAKANELCIRMSALSVEGVQDVVLKKYSHGPGSFTVIPLTENYSDTIKDKLLKTIEENASCGEKIIVKPPIYKEVKLDINLIIKSTVDSRKIQNINIMVASAIDKYINSINIGETLIINKLTNAIMSASDDIINYSFNSFKINNKECLLINQGCRWDEKFVISNDIDSIVIR